MWRRNVSRITIALLALQGVLVLTSSRQLFADTPARSRGTDAIHVFRGAGGARSTTSNPGPGMLNAATLTILAGQVGSTPGTSFVKLTPQSPSVTNRGALVFDSPKLVEGGQGYATWGAGEFSGSVGALWLWLRPSAGKKYLIDCAVRSATPQARFAVTGPAGTAPMKVEAIPAGQHLTFVLDATDNNWVSFQITGMGASKQINGTSTGPLTTRMDWTFYSCEVTNL